MMDICICIYIFFFRRFGRAGRDAAVQHAFACRSPGGAPRCLAPASWCLAPPGGGDEPPSTGGAPTLRCNAAASMAPKMERSYVVQNSGVEEEALSLFGVPLGFLLLREFPGTAHGRPGEA